MEHIKTFSELLDQYGSQDIEAEFIIKYDYKFDIGYFSEFFDSISEMTITLQGYDSNLEFYGELCTDSCLSSYGNRIDNIYPRNTVKIINHKLPCFPGCLTLKLYNVDTGLDPYKTHTFLVKIKGQKLTQPYDFTICNIELDTNTYDCPYFSNGELVRQPWLIRDGYIIEGDVIPVPYEEDLFPRTLNCIEDGCMTEHVTNINAYDNILIVKTDYNWTNAVNEIMYSCQKRRQFGYSLLLDSPCDREHFGVSVPVRYYKKSPGCIIKDDDKAHLYYQMFKPRTMVTNVIFDNYSHKDYEVGYSIVKGPYGLDESGKPKENVIFDGKYTPTKDRKRIFLDYSDCLNIHHCWLVDDEQSRVKLTIPYDRLSDWNTTYIIIETTTFDPELTNKLFP